jgi:hypothetical protein
MKHYVLSLLILFAFSTSMHCFESSQYNACWKKTTHCSRSLLKQLTSSYFTTLLLSGGIGATTGGLVRYLEKRLDVESSPIALFLALTGWLLESELRNDIIIGLQRDLDANHIEHKKSMMFKAAWIASWLAYLQV